MIESFFFFDLLLLPLVRRKLLNLEVILSNKMCEYLSEISFNSSLCVCILCPLPVTHVQYVLSNLLNYGLILFLYKNKLKIQIAWLKLHLFTFLLLLTKWILCFSNTRKKFKIAVFWYNFKVKIWIKWWLIEVTVRSQCFCHSEQLLLCRCKIT